jgi:hypothetical protein
MSCDVAIARAYGTTRLITQEIEEEESLAEDARKISMSSCVMVSTLPQRFSTDLFWVRKLLPKLYGNRKNQMGFCLLNSLPSSAMPVLKR